MYFLLLTYAPLCVPLPFLCSRVSTETVSARLNLKQCFAQIYHGFPPPMPSCSQASVLMVFFFSFFFFFCVGKVHFVKDYIKSVSARKSMQVQIQIPLLSITVQSFGFARVIITRSDRGLDPCGSAEECLCLFVLHILKCLFVSLLEGPWEKG